MEEDHHNQNQANNNGQNEIDPENIQQIMYGLK